MESEMREEWVRVRLDQILEIVRGGSPRPIKNFITTSEDGINWIKIGDTKNSEKYITKAEQKIRPDGLKKSRLVRHGDFLLSNSMSFGRPFILKIEGAIHDGWLALSAKNGFKLNQDFLYYSLTSPNAYIQFDKFATGSTVKNLNIEAVSKTTIPLPPLPEQRAIVARIEELFSELDHSISNLKSAQAKLDIYRQAVLKKAFEGGFTEEWRRNSHVLISGKELLKEIRDEQERWIKEETKLGNSEANRLKSKLKKVKSDFSTLEELPFGWTWTTFLESSNLVVDCHNKTAPYQSEGIFLVRTTNVKKGTLNLSDSIKFVSQETFEYWSRRCVPRSGDILFTREAPMGEVAIIPENTKICLGQRMMLIRVFNNLVNKRYLYYAIQDPSFQQRMDKSAIGTGVKHLRVGDVENLIFPICSPNEQIHIVQEIESRLSVADKLAETIQTNLLKSESLRQSILKQAFEGKLLTEAELEACRKEADWEPAEKLLERVKEEKKIAI